MKYRTRDPLNPKVKKLILNIGERDYRVLKNYSRELNISMAYLVVTAIREFIERKIEK